MGTFDDAFQRASAQQSAQDARDQARRDAVAGGAVRTARELPGILKEFSAALQRAGVKPEAVRMPDTQGMFGRTRRRFSPEAYLIYGTASPAYQQQRHLVMVTVEGELWEYERLSYPEPNGPRERVGIVEVTPERLLDGLWLTSRVNFDDDGNAYITAGGGYGEPESLAVALAAQAQVIINISKQ
jgi:hypothetical protein